MKYIIKPTPQFKRDYRRARQKGLDMEPLNAVIAALAAGEALPGHVHGGCGVKQSSRRVG